MNSTLKFFCINYPLKTFQFHKSIGQIYMERYHYFSLILANPLMSLCIILIIFVYQITNYI